jgi:hypothetical protein
MSKCMKILALGAELFQAARQIHILLQSDVTKQIVAFRDFANSIDESEDFT